MAHRRNNDGVMCEMVKFTSSCTGCCEFGDYGSVALGRFDPKTKQTIGIGCPECGHTGKRRQVLYIPLTELGAAIVRQAQEPK